MSKHTPGPWMVGKHTNDYYQCEVHSYNFEIATCWNHGGTIQEEMKANARLIAAAPELLYQLKRIVDYYSQDKDGWESPIFKDCYDVIKKATGEQC